MKRLITSVCLFVIAFYSYSQVNASYLVKIPDPKYVPEITYNPNGIRISYSDTGIKPLDKLINSYEVYKSEKVFKSATSPSLQNFYLIECNDVHLIIKLNNTYPSFYIEFHNNNGETLFLPNDFGTTGGYTNTDQEELNYIRAQEAWSITKGSDQVIIGISDNSVQTLHEDLSNKVQHVYGNNYPNNISGDNQHGSWVSSFAAADTDNAKGISAIGYNSKIYSATNSWTVGVDTLSRMPGVKVINTAWINSSSVLQNIINGAVEERGVVIVGSAGNGYPYSSESYIYPAAFKNVISVSGIGHQNETYVGREVFLDSHEFIRDGGYATVQHNDSVDIVAPVLGISHVDPVYGVTNGYRDNNGGTSFSSPMVSGTIALMFSVNYCIDPKEVETILKLTAVRIDHLPQNIAYYGKLGAGKLDAYEAVKMSKDMAEPFGTVEVKDRVLYRNWFYKLVTAPYEIKMTNNDVTGDARLKFKARNNIEILSGDYYPSTNNGYIDLSIDESIALDCPSASSLKQAQIKVEEKNSNDKDFIIYPTLVVENLTLVNKNPSSKEMAFVKVYDFYGTEVYHSDKIRKNETMLNLKFLNEGIHVLIIYNSQNEVVETFKIVKK